MKDMFTQMKGRRLMSHELAIFQIIFFPLALTVAYFLFRNLRDRPTDRPTIEKFAARYGLRILSVARGPTFDSSPLINKSDRSPELDYQKHSCVQRDCGGLRR
jgi:hypothetical protein